MDARLVTLWHWFFAFIGGLTAIAFIAVRTESKILFIAIPAAIQLAWTAYVIRSARQAGLKKW
jgi:hypothetical protein